MDMETLRARGPGGPCGRGKPFAVVASASTTNTGSVSRSGNREICRTYGMWMRGRSLRRLVLLSSK